MKKIYSLFFFSFVLLNANAQIQWSWVNSFSGSSSPIGASKIAADAAGGFYVTGSFDGTRPFGSYTLTAAGTSDVYIARYNNTGTCLWAKRFGSALSTTSGNAVCVDGNGDIYISGTYNNYIIIDTNYIFPYGMDDMFIIKLDPSGNTIWYKSCGGYSTDKATTLATDAQKNLYLSGNFRDKAYFDTDSIGNNITNADIFITKFSSAGNVQWVKEAGGSQDDDCSALSVSSNYLYLGGQFSGTANFGGHSVTSSGFSDAYIAKYSLSSGSNIWVKKAGGPPNDFCYGLSTDSFGNAYITGTFYQNASFGNGISLSSGPNDDTYIAKYDTGGTCQWAQKGGGPQGDVSSAIATDSWGYSVISGSFKGTATFGSTPPLTCNGTATDIFVAKYNPSGTCQYALKAGGATGGDIGYSVAYSGATVEFIVSGSFAGSATFGSINISSGGAPYASFISLLPGFYTGIEDETFTQSPLFYPNPATDAIHLNAENLRGAKSISINNVLGQVCFQRDFQTDNDLQIDLARFSPGIYSVEVLYSNSKIFQKWRSSNNLETLNN